MTDADLKVVAGMTQPESLELGTGSTTEGTEFHGGLIRLSEYWERMSDIVGKRVLSRLKTNAIREIANAPQLNPLISSIIEGIK